MQQVLKLGPVDIKQLIGRDDFDVSHQKCRLQTSASDTLFHTDIRDADLVNDIAVCSNDRVVGFASENINNAAGLIIVSSLTPKEWSS